MANETDTLRSWLDEMDGLGLLRTVRGASADYEIGAITDLNAKENKYVLLFDDIPGYASGTRICTGTMLDAQRVGRVLSMPDTGSDMELVAAIRDALRAGGGSSATPAPDVLSVPEKWREVGGPGVAEVADAPVLENRLTGDDVDLRVLPSPLWHEEDGGRYLGTLDAVITKDAHSGWVNAGAYRSMMHDPDTLCLYTHSTHHGGMHLAQYAERGERAPVAISFGHHPLLSVAASLEVPTGISEYDYAAMLRGKPYQVVRAPVTGLPVPADSEIVVEGYIGDEIVGEGPYGEFTGYYAGGAMRTPTIKVSGIYRRDQPVMLGTNAGVPPYDYSYFRCPARAALTWNSLESMGVPGVQGVWCHESGYSRALTIISIRQEFNGHAEQAGLLASQSREGIVGGKYVIVVDDDVDPSDIDQVLWAVTSRTDPARSIHCIENSYGIALDAMVERQLYEHANEYRMSRAVINACRPIARVQSGEFPKVVRVSEELAAKVRGQHPELFG